MDPSNQFPQFNCFMFIFLCQVIYVFLFINCKLVFVVKNKIVLTEKWWKFKIIIVSNAVIYGKNILISWFIINTFRTLVKKILPIFCYFCNQCFVLFSWLKVGTAVVTRSDGRLALGRLGALCEQVCIYICIHEPKLYVLAKCC